MKLAPFLVSILCAFGSLSCATIGVQKSYWERDPGVPVYVFGGTVLDASTVWHSVQPDAGEASIGFLLIFDLPFSLAADALLLPLCIYQQIERAGWEEGEFIARLEDPDRNERWSAARALGRLEGTTDASIDALERALSDVDWSVRGQALASLANLGSRSARTAPAVIARLGDEEEQVRTQAARTLACIDAEPELALPALIAATSDPVGHVRRAAIQTLGEIGGADPAVLQALEHLRSDESRYVREAAEEALARLARRP